MIANECFLYVLVEDIKDKLKLFNNTHVFWTEYFKILRFTSRDRTTLIRRRIDVMVGSPCKQSRRTRNICGFLENCWWQEWFSPIQHEQSSSQHYEFNQKTSILKCKFVIRTRMNTLPETVRRQFYRSKKGVALFTGPYLKSLSLSTSENQA